MVATEGFHVRAYLPGDTKQLLSMMRRLAEFEGYIDQFQVTGEALRKNGFGDRALFHAFVAECSETGDLLGMAISYLIPWTYDLNPTLVLKELYVRKLARSAGVGEALMRSIALRASSVGAARIQWTVLQANARAMNFYSKLGGRQDKNWLPWQMDRRGIDRLSQEGVSVKSGNVQ